MYKSWDHASFKNKLSQPMCAMQALKPLISANPDF